MNVATRGVRNAFRNPIRTLSIVIILGLSIGLALSMFIARQSVDNKIQSVKSSIGNTVSITPAGSQGFQGGGEPLTTAQLAKVSAVPNVTNVHESLSDRLTSTDTNLTSAIEPGSLGNRSGRNSGVGFSVPPPENNNSQRSASESGGTQITRTFTPPIIATASNDMSSATTYGGSTVNFISGKALDATKDANDAVIGKSLASKNNLSVGSTFTAYGSTVTVAGIYDSGTTFSNAGLVFSLPTLQRLSGQPNAVTSATVTINSIDNVDGAVSAIKTVMGNSADVVSNQETSKQALEPLQSVKSISTFSLVAALVAGSVIILLTMVMIVRERRREIGVMKAIGATNSKIVLQFIAEAITLTTLGLFVGLVIGIVSSGPLTKVLVNNSTSSTASQQGGSGAGRGPGGFRGLGNTGLRDIRTVKANIGPEVFVYGFSAALIIAIVGSALPALLISKVRPAEIMRAE